MKNAVKSWRRYIIKENAYAMGTMGVNVASGHISSQCPQGEEQNGFHPNGEPCCRPKPELEQKGQTIVSSRQEIIDIIKNNPHQAIHLDNPKGTVKKFGGSIPIKLPFDYGEWSEFINPADNKGWDLIIVTSATINDDNLIPVGYVAYNENKPRAMFNDKIIIAPDGNYNSEDREIIESVFSQMDYFDVPVWY